MDLTEKKKKRSLAMILGKCDCKGKIVVVISKM